MSLKFLCGFSGDKDKRSKKVLSNLLDNANTTSEQLSQKIKDLNIQLSEKNTEISDLTHQLDKQTEKVQDHSVIIEQLNGRVEDLRTELNNEQSNNDKINLLANENRNKDEALKALHERELIEHTGLANKAIDEHGKVNNNLKAEFAESQRAHKLKLSKEKADNKMIHNNNIKNYNDEIKQLKSQLEQLRTEKDQEIQQQREKHGLDVTQRETNLKETHANYQKSIKDQTSTNENRITDLRTEKDQEIQQLRERHGLDITQRETNLKETHTKYQKSIQDQSSTNENRITDLLETIKSKDNDLAQVSKLEQEVSALKTEEKSLREKLDVTKNKLTISENDRKNKEAQLEGEQIRHDATKKDLETQKGQYQEELDKKTTIAELSSKLKSKDEKNAELLKEYQESRNLDSKLEKLQESNNDLTSEVKEKIQIIATKDSEISNLNNNAETLNRDKKDLQAALENSNLTEKENEALRLKNLELEQHTTKFLAMIDEKKIALEKLGKEEGKSADLNKKVRNLETDNNQLKNSLERETRAKTSLESDNDLLITEHIKISTANRSLKEENVHLTATVSDNKVNLKVLKRQVAILKDPTGRLDTDSDECNQALIILFVNSSFEAPQTQHQNFLEKVEKNITQVFEQSATKAERKEKKRLATKPDDLPGYLKDLEQFKITFDDKKKFQLLVFENLAAEAIFQKCQDICRHWRQINSLSLPDQLFGKLPSAVHLHFMSHGTQKNNLNVLYGSDSNIIGTDHLINQFNGKNCHKLLSIPVLIHFQCCLGDADDHGVMYNPPTKNTGNTKDFDSAAGHLTIDDQIVHPNTNLYVVNSTQKGYRSWTSKDHGSTFYDTYFLVLRDAAQTKSFNYKEIIQKTIERVSVKQVTSSNSNMRQLPEVTKDTLVIPYNLPVLKHSEEKAAVMGDGAGHGKYQGIGVDNSDINTKLKNPDAHSNPSNHQAANFKDVGQGHMKSINNNGRKKNNPVGPGQSANQQNETKKK